MTASGVRATCVRKTARQREKEQATIRWKARLMSLFETISERERHRMPYRSTMRCWTLARRSTCQVRISTGGNLGLFWAVTSDPRADAMLIEHRTLSY